MAFCTDCGTSAISGALFCGACGTRISTHPRQQLLPSQLARPDVSLDSTKGPLLAQSNGQHIKINGFTQTFGLDIRVAVLAVMIDIMAFSLDVVSLGILIPVEIGAAALLGFITYKIQRSWYGDNHDSALIKALIIGLITAIPAPITGFVAAPGGFLGLIHLFRKKT